MTLKNAAVLALAGMSLLTILLLAHLIIDILAVARGVAPAIRLLASLIHVLASVSVLVFFWVFQKRQA
jgi:hypothetical protein